MLIENYRPGTLESMGLGPAVLHARNPKLVIVRVSGWGQTGPYAQKPGFGTLVEGMSGYAAKTGFPDREPVLPPTALADMMAGLYGAYAVMIALREVETKGGKGQVIDLSLLEPIHSVVGADAATYKAAGIIPKRQGSRSNITSPRNVYKTRDDRWLSISGSMQSMAERLYATVGRPRHDQGPALCHQQRAPRQQRGGRASHPRVHRRAAICAECLAIFEAAEVTAAPIYDIDQFVADPHVQERADRRRPARRRDRQRHRAQRHPAPLGDAGRPAPAGAEARRAHGRDPRPRSASTAPTSPSSNPRGSSDVAAAVPICRPGARCCSCR